MVGWSTTNYASGVYLGNGWVLTADHVGALGFWINGNEYLPTTNAAYTSTYGYTNLTSTNIPGYTADLNLYKISSTATNGASLPFFTPLTITSAAPSVSDTVVMTGYGPAQNNTNNALWNTKTWGTNAISKINKPMSVSVSYTNATTGVVTTTTWKSMDFQTTVNGTTYGQVIGGDSGGGDFVNVGGVWELAGLNELGGTTATTCSYVQLSEYDAQILAVMNAVPEPSAWVLLGLGGLAILLYRCRTSYRSS
jgi:hypothetical protein